MWKPFKRIPTNKWPLKLFHKKFYLKQANNQLTCHQSLKFIKRQRLLPLLSKKHKPQLQPKLKPKLNQLLSLLAPKSKQANLLSLKSNLLAKLTRQFLLKKAQVLLRNLQLL